MTVESKPPVLRYAPGQTRGVPAFWIATGLFALAVLAFSRALGNDFINFDDPGYVTENRHVRQGVSLASIRWAFSSVAQSNWHPVTWISHMLDVELFGLAPGGHHLTSVLLHAANGVLVFILLRRLTGRVWASAAVAALFAVHPTHVESVAWVSERKDVLSAFFALLTLIGYAAYARRPAISTYALSLVAYALGLMAKPMLVTLPFVMILLDAWPLERLTWGVAWRRVREKLPFFALAATASIVAFIAQRSAGSVGTLEKYPLDHRLANAVVSTAQYLLKTFWPTNLSIFYPYPDSFTVISVVASLAAILLLTAIAIMQRRKRPWLAVGWFWFLGMLVPVCGLVQIGRQSMADRYLYLPHIGLFIALVWLLSEIALGGRQGAIICGALVIALAGKTYQQAGYWKSSTTLFTHALTVTRNNALAHHQLGNELARLGRLAFAEEHYREAIDIDPTHAKSRLNLANILARRQDYAGAIDQLNDAIRLKPDLAPAYATLGHVLRHTDRLEEADAALAKSIILDPQQPSARVEWGLVLERRGNVEAAAEQFNQALMLDPANQAAQEGLARLRAREPGARRRG